MLLDKARLETRVRFFIGLAVTAALCAFIVLFRPIAVERMASVLRLHPELHKPWWFDRVVSEYAFYIWKSLFEGWFRNLWLMCAVLLGVGGLTQESATGSAAFTLSLPIRRRHVAAAYVVAGSLELAILALVPVVVAPALSPFVHASYAVGEAACRGLILAFGGLVVFGFSFAVSAAVESASVPMIVSIAALVALASLLAPYSDGLTEPLCLRAVDLFRLISGPPDLLWSTFPWKGLLLSVTVASTLALLAVWFTDVKDYR